MLTCCKIGCDRPAAWEWATLSPHELTAACDEHLNELHGDGEGEPTRLTCRSGECEFVGRQNGGPPDDAASYEWVSYCRHCGREHPGSGEWPAVKPPAVPHPI